MNRITFSLEDVKAPDKLERVLQQFRSAIETPIIQAPTKFSPQSVNVGELAGEIAKLIQPELQATGKAPLNLTNLLPGTAAASVVSQGTHVQRVGGVPPTSAQIGTLYFETDRHVLYIVSPVSGTPVYVFVAGVYSDVRANVPTDLGLNDDGFIFEVLDYSHTAIWDGTAWRLTDGGGGYIVDAVAPLMTGWQLCDGTVTDYIVNNTTNLSVAPFTTPNENGSPGTYHASIAGYTGVINPAVPAIISGNTGSNVAGVTLNIVVDNVPSGGTKAVMDDTSSITDPGHTHPAGTLVNDLSATPPTLGVRRYFRR